MFGCALVYEVEWQLKFCAEMNKAYVLLLSTGKWWITGWCYSSPLPHGQWYMLNLTPPCVHRTKASAQVHAHTHACARAHTHTHTRTHIYTHTCMHTHSTNIQTYEVYLKSSGTECAVWAMGKRGISRTVLSSNMVSWEYIAVTKS